MRRLRLERFDGRVPDADRVLDDDRVTDADHVSDADAGSVSVPLPSAPDSPLESEDSSVVSEVSLTLTLRTFPKMIVPSF
ncbi:hypothetical protein [Paenibacillus harenae]|uniref:hypothetical protein n=1 Tax=Paenibacillus harenae TaxID=306543 RepID=UPI0012EC0009|nr:hypothetical protein [Paenibacillus harenae]